MLWVMERGGDEGERVEWQYSTNFSEEGGSGGR